MSDFNKYSIIELPRSVIIGHGVLSGIPKDCERLGLAKSAFLVVDEVTKEIAGLEIEGYLQDAGYDTDMVTVKEADSETIETVEELAREFNAGFIMGIGGGRPIDVAKCASYNIARHFISVPTAASHDGIVSSRASVLVDGVKTSLEAQSPIAVVADTGIISKSPHRMLAAGCGDIISNKTAVLDWKLAQRLRNEEFSSYAATLSEITADMLIENANEIKPNLEESAWAVVKALTASGVAMSIAGSSRPASGSEHKFSHALDAIAEKPALHGEQCGIGSIMMMYLHGGNWEKLRDSLEIIGAPIDISDLELTREDIIQALVKAHDIKPERYTILGYHGLTEEAAETLAEKTGVI